MTQLTNSNKLSLLRVLSLTDSFIHWEKKHAFPRHNTPCIQCESSHPLSIIASATTCVILYAPCVKKTDLPLIQATTAFPINKSKPMREQHDICEKLIKARKLDIPSCRLWHDLRDSSCALPKEGFVDSRTLIHPLPSSCLHSYRCQYAVTAPCPALLLTGSFNRSNRCRGIKEWDCTHLFSRARRQPQLCFAMRSTAWGRCSPQQH